VAFFVVLSVYDDRILTISIMKRLLFVLIVLLIMLQYRLWLGDKSFADSIHLQEQIKLQQASNAQLVARNQVLREEINDLRSGTEAVEERARNELGMVMEGETFFRVVGGDNLNK